MPGKEQNFFASSEHWGHRRHHDPEQGPLDRGRHHGHGGHHGRGGHHGHERHGLYSGRKLSASDLHLILLALLAQQPAHGYELIKLLEDHSHGLYVPSPGMIYPALTYLEEIGFASVAMEGNKKRYSLTEAGRNQYEQNRAVAARILSDMEHIGARMAQARQAVESGLVQEESDYGTTSEEMETARRALRSALHEKEPYTTEEAHRIAAILHRATADIHQGLRPQAAEALFAAILNRRSMGLSRFKPDPVDRRLIERMLEAANWAPSHGDTEPWRFTVFSGEGRAVLAELFDTAHREEQADSPASQAHEGARKRAFAAPVWISIGMSPARKEDGSLLMSEEEEMMAVACAVQNLHLMASALGLAGMWHSKGISVHPTIARGLGLEAPARLLGFFMCGWPATDWLTSTRRPLSEKVHWVEGR